MSKECFLHPYIDNIKLWVVYVSPCVSEIQSGDPFSWNFNLTEVLKISIWVFPFKFRVCILYTFLSSSVCLLRSAVEHSDTIGKQQASKEVSVHLHAWPSKIILLCFFLFTNQYLVSSCICIRVLLNLYVPFPSYHEVIIIFPNKGWTKHVIPKHSEVALLPNSSCVFHSPSSSSCFPFLLVVETCPLPSYPV